MPPRRIVKWVPTAVEIFAPLHPEHVKAAPVPEYAAVHEDLKRVLESSSVAESAGSFKSGERHGNLQLTFFSTLQQPQAFKVDCDIDDAAGLGHPFQVLRNFVTQGTTHPYDIHQILVFRQDAMLPYDLA
jgi:hypothetical protein